MLQLYIANKNYSSWSLRPWVLMQQLGIEFEEILVPFGLSKDPAGFHAFSPTGKVPCLVDNGTTIWDSLAIIEYLAESHATVWPANKVARAWARSASAEMHSGFGQIRNICGMNCGLRVKLYAPEAELLTEWQRVDQLWCEGLDKFGGPFLAGDHFTAVDAFYAPLAFRAQTYTPALSEQANQYVQRLLALAPMQQWYQAALAEGWRDDAHEEEAKAVGEWLADFRSEAD
ncbi:glutathione S-transferase family protein [Neptunicella sp.]|uniref:glutathione S-transferase family protein n=1 Tax=Neptunicella sp. TaxID=2125986 RepID=UPI003F692D56